MREAIDKSVAALHHTLTVAGLNYEVWWLYKSADTRPLYIGKMNQYSLFFQTSLHAHFVALVVALYRLYETRTDTHNIPSTLRTAKDNGLLESSVLDDLYARYEAIKPLWVKVSVLRNNVFGHRSREFTEAEAFAEAGLSPNDLRDLWKSTCELLNVFTRAWDSGAHAFNLGARQDLERLFDALPE